MKCPPNNGKNKEYNVQDQKTAIAEETAKSQQAELNYAMAIALSIIRPLRTKLQEREKALRKRFWKAINPFFPITIPLFKEVLCFLKRWFFFRIRGPQKFPQSNGVFSSEYRSQTLLI